MCPRDPSFVHAFTRYRGTYVCVTHTASSGGYRGLDQTTVSRWKLVGGTTSRRSAPSRIHFSLFRSRVYYDGEPDSRRPATSVVSLAPIDPEISGRGKHVCEIRYRILQNWVSSPTTKRALLFHWIEAHTHTYTHFLDHLLIDIQESCEGLSRGHLSY